MQLSVKFEHIREGFQVIGLSSCQILQKRLLADLVDGDQGDIL